MSKKFLEVKGSADLTLISIKSIDSLMILKNQVEGYLVIIAGKWVSCNESYDTLDEAKNRVQEIVSQIESK